MMGFAKTGLTMNQAVRVRMARSMSLCTLRDNEERIKKSSSNLLNEASAFESDYRRRYARNEVIRQVMEVSASKSCQTFKKSTMLCLAFLLLSLIEYSIHR